jgi:hypothetical protein
MPLDVLGRTRATLSGPTGEDARERFPIPKSARAGDRGLQFSLLNEEYLVSVGHQPALNTSLPFVHTARRSYRLSGPVRTWDCCDRGSFSGRGGNLSKPYHLEEGEVVTRFP